MVIPYVNLPFSPDSLEPFISKQTMDTHYEKHYKSYVDHANRLIEGSEFETSEIDEILMRSYSEQTELFNNVAQAWNHSFFWKCLRAERLPSSNLQQTLKSAFGDLESFKTEFNQAAMNLFGSGWVWLVRERQGQLKIRALPNAENPLLNDETPILTCDVWEHAYYLDYKNERAGYLKNFWSVLNWDFVESNLMQVLPQLRRERRPNGDLTTAREFERARASHR